MSERRRDLSRWVARIAIVASMVLLVASLVTPEPGRYGAGLKFSTTLADGRWLPFGTDRRGAPFGSTLLDALRASGAAALVGTLAVLLGALTLGTLQASLRSRFGKLAAQALTLCAMAMPDVTLLLTVHASLGRETPGYVVDLIVLGVIGILWVPPTSRLITSRVQALRASQFFLASRSMGATEWYQFRREIAPHLVEDLGWLFASIYPRFLHVELGLAYIGVEYHFRGVGQLLKSSYESSGANPYMLHLAIASVAAIWLSILPMLVLRTLGGKTVPSL